MKIYNVIIRYRFWLSLLAFLISVILNFNGVGFWPTFPLYFIGLIGILSHFLIGPLRLIQAPMEAGKMDEVQKILQTIWFPNLLIKPIRSIYFTLLGNLAMMNQDFTTAEKHLKKSSNIGSSMVEAESANKLQLGLMALQKGNFKEAESYIRTAIKIGFIDKESESMAYLSMCQIFINKREFRASKDYFRRAKACKPKTKQVLDQIKEIEKYISRIPG